MRIALIITAAVVGGVTLLAVGGLTVVRLRTPSAEEMDLGLHAGALRPCPESPNCVSTYATDELHSVEPISLTVTPDQAAAAARAALQALPRTKLISESAGYLHAESRTAVFGFIDDVEVLVVPDGDGSVLHFRSASRVGYGDAGTNRRRYHAFAEAVENAL